jgi:enolase
MTAVISAVRAREILDSGGRPTVEAELELDDGTFVRSSVPSGASTGRHEAHELRDRDPARYAGNGVLAAVANVRETIGPAVIGLSPFDQAGLDALLAGLDGTEDKSVLGANAILAVSTAIARAAAASKGIPLWQSLGGGTLLPLPMVNIISGGLHADSRLAFQDFLVLPVGASSFSEALESVSAVRNATAELLHDQGHSTLKAAEGGFGPPLAGPEAALDLLVQAVERAGRVLGDEIAFAVDVAATHFFDGGVYHLPDAPSDLDAEAMIDRLERLVDSYPIVSVEDGLAEDDWQGWSLLTERLGARVQLLGDDLFTTSSTRLAHGIESRAANSVLVKLNQIGTLTEALAVIEQAQAARYAPVVSARSGETSDDFIADLAVGTEAGQIKIGSLAQSERLAKYNQLLRIEERLGAAARFAGRDALAPLARMSDDLVPDPKAVK